MPDKKLTDSEIKKAREVSLKEQIEHCNERLKETLDSYYRRNTNGAEEPLEICVLRESARLIPKLVDLINRQELKIKGLNRLLYSFLDTRNGDLVHITDNELEIIKKPIKAEAYKEFAEKAIKQVEKVRQKYQRLCEEQGEEMEEHMHIHFNGIIGIINNLLKETYTSSVTEATPSPPNKGEG